MEVKKVGIVGFTGVMGSGITQLCAQSGCDVIGFSRHSEKAAKTIKLIDGFLSRAVEKEKITPGQKEATLSRIQVSDKLEDMSDCDFIIETATENMELKREIFKQLDRICPPHAILSTNTSSLSIIDMAMATGRPEKVLGMHFFNPAPLMKLLEIVRTIATGDEAVEKARAFGQQLGKTIVIATDSPGYIVNTLMVPYLLNAVRMMDRGIATKEDIDAAITLGLNYPMGPLAVCDFIGLDSLLFVANVMYDESKDPQYAPPPLLRKMVTAGWLGRKSGKGFYEYQS